jgi:hypothetical protein
MMTLLFEITDEGRTIVMTAVPHPVPPDALLVERIAALSDRTALAELDARYGMTLYALAYGVVFDPRVAEAAVTAAFRDVWRSAASFDPRQGTVARWLAGFTRSRAQGRQGSVSPPPEPRSRAD